jgi:transcriptional regulator with XRE-family HTH domain
MIVNKKFRSDDMIHEKLRENRQKKDMSITDVAKLLGVSKMSISNYERGLRLPSIEKLYKLMMLYDLTQEDIIEWLKEISK